MKKICIVCGDTFIPTGKNHKRCGSVNAKTGCSWKRKMFLKTHYKDGTIRRSKKTHRKWGSSSQHLLPLIKDNDKCGDCGGTSNLTVEHIIPQSIGGQDNIENLRVLCMGCNLRSYHRLVKKALRFYLLGED